MRTGKIFILVIAFFMSYPVFAFAEDAQEQKTSAADEAKKEKQASNERMATMAMSMMAMMQKQMVASGDGGVIILTGNKLLKYDKDLNLIKAVELKTSVDSTQK